MRIDGRALATEILLDLQKRVSKLEKKPILAVVQVGDDPGSTSYINQKKIKGEEIGINVLHKHFPETVSENSLVAHISKLNSDPEISGIIIQRPLPSHLSPNVLTSQIAKEKDVDGFREDSPFTPPVALGVLYILKSIKLDVSALKHKKIVLLGRGETAGHPIAQTFEKLKIPVTILHSKSNVDDPAGTLQTLNSADIIISCVGKRVIKQEDLKKGVVLVGVGIHRGFKGLEGDYDDNEIGNIASFYTPTPGGVGPLTVAFLLSNVVGH